MRKINLLNHDKLTYDKIKTPDTEVMGYTTRVYQGVFYFVKPKKGELGNQYFDIREIEEKQKADVIDDPIEEEKPKKTKKKTKKEEISILDDPNDSDDPDDINDPEKLDDYLNY